MKFISLTNLTYFWGKVKTYVANAISTAKTDLTTQLNAKAPKDSPALTGTPTAPTAAADTNTDQIATTKFVKSAIAAIPSTDLSGYATNQSVDEKIAASEKKIFGDGELAEAFDTIKEIGDYLKDHDNVAKVINEAIAKKADKTELANYYDKTTADGKFATKDELGGYVKNADLVEVTEAEIDALFN